MGTHKYSSHEYKSQVGNTTEVVNHASEVKIAKKCQYGQKCRVEKGAILVTK
jgi:hypothetical protein